MLRHEEGYRKKAYKDTKGIWTVGIGHNLVGNELTDRAIMCIFEDDLSEALRIAQHFAGAGRWSTLTDNQKYGLINMAFQMGARLMSFKNMRQALGQGQWDIVEAEALDSDWAREHEDRARRVIGLLRREAYPY